jgi:hypothetical protein
LFLGCHKREDKGGSSCGGWRSGLSA